MTKRSMQVATLALLVAGLNAAPLLAQGKTFKVGVPLPLTGAEAKFGEMEKQAYEMAVEEINAKAGAKGTKLALDIQDSGGKPETATAIVEKFITIDKYPIVVGEYTSQCSYAVAGVAEKYKVPYLVVDGRRGQDHPAGLEVRLPAEPAREPLQHGRLRLLRGRRQAQVDRDPLREHRLREHHLEGDEGVLRRRTASDRPRRGLPGGRRRLQADPAEGQVAPAGRRLHGFVPHGRLAPDAPVQGARHQPPGVHRRRRGPHAPRVPPERGRCLGVLLLRDALDAAGQVSRREGLLRQLQEEVQQGAGLPRRRGLRGRVRARRRPEARQVARRPRSCAPPSPRRT